MMSDIKSQHEKEKTMANDSAQFVHDITTPLAIIQILAKTLEEYLPALLSSHQKLKDQGGTVIDIPQEQYDVLANSATRIKILTQEVNNTAKEYWKKIDAQISEVTNSEDSHLLKIKPVIHSGKRLHILVAEDDAIHQKISSRLLSDEHSVDIAANGKEAIEACRKKNYDVILMDLHMPVMNGQEATAEIVKLENASPVIVGLTNRPLGSERKQLQQQGFSAFLEKPLNIDEFKKIMKELSFN